MYQAYVFENVYDPIKGQLQPRQRVLRLYRKKPSNAEIQRLALQHKIHDKIEVELC